MFLTVLPHCWQSYRRVDLTRFSGMWNVTHIVQKSVFLETHSKYFVFVHFWETEPILFVQKQIIRNLVHVTRIMRIQSRIREVCCIVVSQMTMNILGINMLGIHDQPKVLFACRSQFCTRRLQTVIKYCNKCRNAVRTPHRAKLVCLLLFDWFLIQVVKLHWIVFQETQ